MIRACKSGENCVNPQCGFCHPPTRKMVAFVKNSELIDKYIDTMKIDHLDFPCQGAKPTLEKVTLDLNWICIDNDGTKLKDDAFCFDDRFLRIAATDPFRALEIPSLMNRIKKVGFTYYTQSGKTRLLDAESENSLGFSHLRPSAACVLTIPYAKFLDFSKATFTREIILIKKIYTFENASKELERAESPLSKLVNLLALGPAFFSDKIYRNASFVSMSFGSGFAITKNHSYTGRNLVKNLLDIFDACAMQKVTGKTIRSLAKETTLIPNHLRPYRTNNFPSNSRETHIYTDEPLNSLHYIKFTSPLLDLGWFINLARLYQVEVEINEEEFFRYITLLDREQMLDNIIKEVLDIYEKNPYLFACSPN